MPDIDLDIPDNRRGVLQYPIKYGHQRVAQILLWDACGKQVIVTSAGSLA